MLVRSLSFASMGCLGIDRDVVPFSYLLRFADRVVNLRLPWLYDMVDATTQVESGDAPIQNNPVASALTPQYVTVMEEAPKGRMIVANSPFLGHVLCQVVEKTVTIRRMDKSPLSTISLSGVDVGIQRGKEVALGGGKEVALGGEKEVALKGEKEVALKGRKEVALKGEKEVALKGRKEVALKGGKEVALKGEKEVALKGGKEVALQGNKQPTSQNNQQPHDNGKQTNGGAQSDHAHSPSSQDTVHKSPLDSLLEEMRSNATDLVSRYNEQLNASANSDEHVYHSVLSRILKEYMVWVSRVLDRRRRGSPRSTR